MALFHPVKVKGSSPQSFDNKIVRTMLKIFTSTVELGSPTIDTAAHTYQN